MAFEATVGTPCSLGALLAGLAVSLLLSGLADAFVGLFGAIGGHRVLVAGALICLAVGPLIPLRVAALLRLSRPVLRGTARGDIPLMWTTLAVFSLLAGLGSALMPLWLPMLQQAGAWCLGRFLWTPRVLAVVQLAVVSVCLVPVMTPLGIALSCLHRLAAPDHGWNVAPLGWALVGAGLGATLSGAMERAGYPAGTVALAAAVPMLLLAVLAAHRAGSRSASDSGATTALALPDLRDDSPTFIRLATAWLTAATAMVVVVWPEVWGQWYGPAMSDRALTPAIMIAMTGVGLVVCERSKRSRSPSIGGLGLACVLSGVGVAAAAALPACWSSAGSAGPELDWVPVAAGSVAAVLMGYTAAYGQLAVLCRVGSRAASGA